MLNLEVGSPRTVDGGSCIATEAGIGGHAVYGPYVALDPGDYAVEFSMSAGGGRMPAADEVCAIIDVTNDFGQETLARRDIYVSELGADDTFTLSFRLLRASRVEFRVYVTGVAALLVAEHRRFVRVGETGGDPAAQLAIGRFPGGGAHPPAIWHEHRATFRRLHERGATVKIDGDDVILSIKGVSFHARSADDLLFIEEIFFQSAYNILPPRDCCVIDIGMNIGLVSLSLATRDTVMEIHAFEPFRDTYNRALANLALNPALAAKITPHNVAVSDKDEDAVLSIFDFPDSGGMSAREVAGGRPVHIITVDAATALRPIIAAARAQRRDVICKVDCEGAEFPIFASLEAAGLLGAITAFMVEWHSVYEGKTQHDLIGPLNRAGFVVFDLTSKPVNGFFYAVRSDQPVGAL